MSKLVDQSPRNLPLFHNGISRKIGPAPRLEITGWLSQPSEHPRFVTVDGRLDRISGQAHMIWARMSAARGWLRFVPPWLNAPDSAEWKLWFLGRTEFSKMPKAGDDAADPFVMSRVVNLSSRSILENHAIAFSKPGGVVRRIGLGEFAEYGLDIADLRWRDLAR